MNVPEFVITDEEGEPENIVNPIEIADPEPKAAPKKKPVIRQDPAPKVKRPPGRPSKSDLEREAGDTLATLLTLLALLLSKVDKDGCALVLEKQSKDIANALAAILAKHPGMLQKLMGTSSIMDYMMLAVALTPVAVAVNEHHIKPAMTKRETDGSI